MPSFWIWLICAHFVRASLSPKALRASLNSTMINANKDRLIHDLVEENARLAEENARLKGQNSAASSSSPRAVVRFLGREYSLQEWQKATTDLACMQGNGTWAKAPGGRDEVKLYDKACTHWYNEGPFCQPEKVHERAAMNYSWTSSPQCAPPVKPWSREAMCEMIRQSKINMFVVGDSISYEFFASLLSALILPTPQDKCDSNGSNGEFWPLCNSSEVLLGARNVFLDLHQDPSKSDSDHEPFSHLISKHSVNLMIINRGVHFIDTEKVLEQLNLTLSNIFLTHPDMSIVYRNSVPGHGQQVCLKNNDPPLITAAEQEKGLGEKSYHWDNIYSQNLKIHALLKEHFPQVLVLDVFSSTILRQDSHRQPTMGGDCLHYCIPGPTDNWVVLLYNALAHLQSAGRKTS